MLHFGDFELDPVAGELRRSGTLLKLAPQPAKVLALLASRPGQMLTREEIRREIWGPDTFVDFEHGLNSCIKQIRIALGDATYIETLPRRGYRFIAQERTNDFRSAAIFVACLLLGVLALQLTGSRPRKLNDRIMLAVLPFENLSADAGQEYFSDGLTEEMITQLGRLQPGRLGVIARTSAMQYKKSRKSVHDIGRELGVDYLLEGAVRRDGQRIRITAQLIQVRDQTDLWTESYERDLAGALDVQSLVARRIAQALATRLLAADDVPARSEKPWPAAWPQRTLQARAATSNSLAYESYLKGLHFLSERTEAGFGQALESFERAVREDPLYALAYAGIADTYNLMGEYYLLPPKKAFPKAKEAAVKALEIDDTLAEAHTSLAFVMAKYEWDWTGAEARFVRAIELNPGYATAHQWYAELLSGMGRHEQAIAEIERARRLDPLSLIINSVEGYIYYNARRYDQAIAQCRKVLDRDPHFLPAAEFLRLAYEQKGMAGPARAESAFERSVRFKKPKEEKIREDSPPYSVAASFASSGRKEQALEWLDRAYAHHDALLAFAKVDPNFDTLRSDPRFNSLLRRVGLQR